MKLKVGSQVEWKWLGRAIKGVVKEIYFKPITQEIKGKKIKRNGTAENPAYLVESEAGNLALKLQSELQPAQNEKTKSSKPQMFK
jgi:Hypervirulence associated proteins TUDOR domain